MAAGIGVIPPHLTTEALSHAQKVCRFYKKAYRTQQALHGRLFLLYRAQTVALRAEFDKNKFLAPKEAQQKLDEGWNIYKKNMCIQPLNFPLSPGGISYKREGPTYDYVLDAWHPLEKAQYPKYFATRDVRKREFIERYDKWMAEKKKAETSETA